MEWDIHLKKRLCIVLIGLIGMRPFGVFAQEYYIVEGELYKEPSITTEGSIGIEKQYLSFTTGSNVSTTSSSITTSSNIILENASVEVLSDMMIYYMEDTEGIDQDEVMMYDLNGDGIVDINDYIIMAKAIIKKEEIEVYAYTYK